MLRDGRHVETFTTLEGVSRETLVQRMVGPAQWGRIAMWMAVGLAQFVLGGLAALLLWPLDRERSARASATAFGGLGKVLWTPRFRPALYGSGLVS